MGHAEGEEKLLQPSEQRMLTFAEQRSLDPQEVHNFVVRQFNRNGTELGIPLKLRFEGVDIFATVNGTKVALAVACLDHEVGLLRCFHFGL